MANEKIPPGYKWAREVDPNVKWDPKTRIVETKYKTYLPGEYLLIDGKAYIPEPYANRYKNPKQLEGIQHDPSQMKAIDFKQDYTVLIRKKTYYAITQGNDEEYLELFQINNFMSLRTSHNVYGKPATASLTLKGGTRVIVASKQAVKDKNWANFQQVLKGWNNIDQEKYGTVNGVQYNDLQRAREKAYDWAYAEKCDFEPMDEVYIFSKSPKRASNGEYPFVQIFFGYISTVQKTYQSGMQGPMINITAEDQLKLLSLSRMANKLPQDMAVSGTAFRFDGAGNFIVETDFTLNGIDLQSKNKDGSYNPARTVTNYSYTNIFAGRTPHEIIKICCIEAGIAEKFLKNRIEEIRRTPFTPQFSPMSNEILMGDFKNRLWMCQQAANILNLEFFADEEGNIVLKIPSYNIGINKLKSNNLGVEAPVILDENYKRTIKLTTLEVSTSHPDMYYVPIKSESLYDIARNFLNNGALWAKIYALNPHIKDPNNVPAGTRVLISEKPDETQKINKSYTETIKLPPQNTLSELTDEYIPVIYPEQIMSFSFVDSDKELFTSAQVTVDVPLIQAQANAVPQSITRTVADFELIKKFGFRDHPQTTSPIISDANGAAIYAGLLIVKSLASRYSGSLTIIEDPTIKVGMPIRFLVYDENPFHELRKFKPGNDNSYAQAVFYVDAIERSINVDGVSTMTLTLKAGRMMGMPSIYDQCQELYRYFYEDVDVDLSKPKEDVKVEAPVVSLSGSTNSKGGGGGSSGGSSGSNSSGAKKKSTKSIKELEADSYNGYTSNGGSRGFIHTVMNAQQAYSLEAPIRNKHLYDGSIYPETVHKIALIAYGTTENWAVQKIIDANKGQYDGRGKGEKFDIYLSRLYPGQKIRIPHTVRMEKFPTDFKKKYLS